MSEDEKAAMEIVVRMLGVRQREIAAALGCDPDVVEAVGSRHAKPLPHDPLHLTEAEVLRKQAGKPVSPSDLWKSVFGDSRLLPSGDGVALTSAPPPVNPEYVAKRYGDPQTGILHPIGEKAVHGCHCKNCDNRWVDFAPPPLETGEYDSETGKFMFWIDTADRKTMTVMQKQQDGSVRPVEVFDDAKTVGDLNEASLTRALGELRAHQRDAFMRLVGRDGIAAIKDGQVITAAEMRCDGNAAKRNSLVVTQTMEDGTTREFKPDPSMLTGDHSWSADLLGGLGCSMAPRSGEIPVTPEMLERGRYAGDPYLSDDELTVKYRAMHAVAPDDWASDFVKSAAFQAQKERLAKAEAERDEANARAQWAVNALDASNRDLANAQSDVETYSIELAAKDARIAELKSELALRPAAFIAPVPESETPGWLRVKDPDRRRMGP